MGSRPHPPLSLYGRARHLIRTRDEPPAIKKRRQAGGTSGEYFSSAPMWPRSRGEKGAEEVDEIAGILKSDVDRLGWRQIDDVARANGIRHPGGLASRHLGSCRFHPGMVHPGVA